jgi:hypothetical protein
MADDNFVSVSDNYCVGNESPPQQPPPHRTVPADVHPTSRGWYDSSSHRADQRFSGCLLVSGGIGVNGTKGGWENSKSGGNEWKLRAQIGRREDDAVRARVKYVHTRPDLRCLFPPVLAQQQPTNATVTGTVPNNCDCWALSSARLSAHQPCTTPPAPPIPPRTYIDSEIHSPPFPVRVEESDVLPEHKVLWTFTATTADIRPSLAPGTLRVPCQQNHPLGPPRH